MKKSLYVFNPENDLALADGSWNYTAPKHAKKIKDDLQMLPVWFAEPGSAVLADKSNINCGFLNDIREKFYGVKDVTVFDADDCIGKIIPWGWSPAICYQLNQFLDSALMPCEASIKSYRCVSHRRTSMSILKNLGYEGVFPVECYTLKEVGNFLDVNGDCIVKAPWSSSGKGVFLVTKRTFEAYQPLIRGFIKKQGSIICEKFLDKVLDFAMEFRAESGSIIFSGLSVFENNSRFSYDRAVVGAYDVLLQKITKYVTTEEVEELKQGLLKVLSKIVPKEYNGYFGVDMMVFYEKGKYQIMPCIELNLRTTMGFLASVIGENILKKGVEGQMSILYHKSHKDLKEYIRGVKLPIIENGRLVGGSLLLVPIYPDSQFTASIDIL